MRGPSPYGGLNSPMSQYFYNGQVVNLFSSWKNTGPKVANTDRKGRGLTGLLYGVSLAMISAYFTLLTLKRTLNSTGFWDSE